MKKDMKDNKVKELQDKVAELENGWKRALADYTNLQKRTDEEKKQIFDFANEILILKLLPILDNFGKLEEHTNDQGLLLTIKEFKGVLEGSGLEEIKTEGDFNPNEMEAIEMSEGEKNKVIKVTQKGYKLNGKLIRPARVCVGLGKKEE